MTAHVQHTKHEDDRWIVTIDRDVTFGSNMAGQSIADSSRLPEPPITDLPDDIRKALAEWVVPSLTAAEGVVLTWSPPDYLPIVSLERPPSQRLPARAGGPAGEPASDESDERRRIDESVLLDHLVSCGDDLQHGVEPVVRQRIDDEYHDRYYPRSDGRSHAEAREK